MRSVGSFEAKTKLAELLASVAEGEEVLITRRGEPIAMLVPAPKKPTRDLKHVIAEMFEARDRSGPRLGGLSLRELLEEGRY